MKCGVINRSAKETGKGLEQWGWELEVTGKWDGGWPKFEKKGGGR